MLAGRAETWAFLVQTGVFKVFRVLTGILREACPNDRKPLMWLKSACPG